MIGAPGLIERRRLRTTFTWVAVAISVLVRTIRSANASWFAVSEKVSTCLSKLTASAVAITPSKHSLDTIPASDIKLCTTGPGSAKPLVSTSILSNDGIDMASLRSSNCSIVSTKSFRRAQHRHPVSSRTISSATCLTKW